ncbi:MAG: SLC13 family permease [Betaproteobacteria bacterium]|nr:MAG: SLC13 family permease [Betaproteobacteria bacterium]
MLPPAPDAHGIAVLVLIVFALFLFTRETIALESSCLLVLIALVVGFTAFPYQRAGVDLDPAEFFAGFGHEALVTICALMILGRGMETTGALRPLAAALSRMWSVRPVLSLLLTLAFAAIASAFFNNTPIVVMLLPVLISASLRSKQPASGILLPMGLATLVGGMGTTIGTSTNLLVISIASDLGMRRFEMFDFMLPAAIAAGIAIVYLWLVAPRLLPERTPLLADTSPRVFEAMLHIGKDSFAVGKSFSEVLAKTEERMKVLSIHRGANLTVSKLPTTVMSEGDRLLVRDSPENLKEFEHLLQARLYNIADDATPVNDEHPLLAEGQQLAEIVVTEHSPLCYSTVRQARYTDRYGLMILAIHRARGQTTLTKGDLNGIVLQVGDVLLAQGAADSLAELRSSGDTLVLDATVDLPHTAKAPIALAIMFLVVAVAALDIAPIAVSALAGMGLMLLTRCLTWTDAAEALSTQVILIVAVSLAMGLALTRTGGADYLAQLYVALAGGLPPVMVMSGLMLLMAILTNIVSNNAAAVIGTPIAISIAHQLGLSPEAFVLAVLFGANMSYATPVAYKTNLLIFSAGGYKFTDFLRVGVPLVLLMWIAFTLLLPIFYPL